MATVAVTCHMRTVLAVTQLLLSAQSDFPEGLRNALEPFLELNSDFCLVCLGGTPGGTQGLMLMCA